MADQRQVRHEYADPASTAPGDLVEIVNELLEAEQDVMVAKLRQRIDTFGEYEIRRELELALLLREPPTESTERARSVLLSLSQPLMRRTALNPHVIGAAAVPIFERHGAVIYERA
jgi:hypothetical protein